MEFEIGIGKTARRAYGFDEVAIVPSRRTRDPDDVDIGWEIDAYAFPLPMMASAMDASVSPATAIEVGRLGGLACLNLEGLWTRYEDPTPVYEEIASLPDEKATRRMQELYLEPIKEELIGRRIREITGGRDLPEVLDQVRNVTEAVYKFGNVTGPRPSAIAPNEESPRRMTRSRKKIRSVCSSRRCWRRGV